MDQENAAKMRLDLSFKGHSEEAKTRWKKYKEAKRQVNELEAHKTAKDNT